jgi:hypothetical protein
MQLVGVKSFMTTLWTDWIKWAIVGFGKSIWAFCSSPQVWLAGVACAIIGYYGGYLIQQGKVSVVSADNSALHGKVLVAEAEVKKLKAKAADDARKAATTPPTVAAVEPTAPVPVPVPPKKKLPKAVPISAPADKPWWSVFLP